MSSTVSTCTSLPVRAVLSSDSDVVAQLVDVDVGRVVIDDVGQFVQRLLSGEVHRLQVVVQFVAQPGTQLGVLVVDLTHPIHSQHVQLVDRLVQRRRLHRRRRVMHRLQHRPECNEHNTRQTVL